MGVNVVSKTHHRFMIASRVLHSNFNRNTIHLTISVDRFIKDNILVFIDVFHIRRDTTFVVIMFLLFETLTLICDRDTEPLVQKG